MAKVRVNIPGVDGNRQANIPTEKDSAGYRVIPTKSIDLEFRDVKRSKKQQKKVDNLYERDSFDGSVIDVYHKTRGKINLI